MRPPLGLALRFTVSGAWPVVGLAPAVALSAGDTTTTTDPLTLCPAASVSVTAAV